VGLAPTARRENRELALPPPGGDAEEDISRKLEGLTEGIPDYRGFEEIPR